MRVLAFFRKYPRLVTAFITLLPLSVLEIYVRVHGGDWSSRLPWLPSGVFSRLIADLAQGDPLALGDRNFSRSLSSHWLTTAGNWAVAFGAASLIGVAVGTILGLSRTAHRVAFPVVHLLRSIPSAALWALLGLTLGFGWLPRLSLVVFGSVWPIVMNTSAALRAIHPEVEECLAFMDLSSFQSTIIRLRWASGGVLTGLELGAGVALLLTVTLEVLWTSDGGVGFYLMTLGHQLQNLQATLAGCVLIAGTGLVVNQSMAQARVVLVPWEGGAHEAVRLRVSRLLRPARHLLTPWLGAPNRHLASQLADEPTRRLICASRVSDDSRAIFGETVVRILRYNKQPPFVFPRELTVLGVRRSFGNSLLQRDSVLVETDSSQKRILMFSRSWVRVESLPTAVVNELVESQTPMGDIFTNHGLSWGSVDIRFDVELSTDLGMLLGSASSISVLKRTRQLTIDGVAVVIAYEYVPFLRAR